MNSTPMMEMYVLFGRKLLIHTSASNVLIAVPKIISDDRSLLCLMIFFGGTTANSYMYLAVGLAVPCRTCFGLIAKHATE